MTWAILRLAMSSCALVQVDLVLEAELVPVGFGSFHPLPQQKLDPLRCQAAGQERLFLCFEGIFF